MSLLRLIARLDIKGQNVVKGVQMEGLRVMGKPMELARRYAQEADELLYIDTVASLYGRNQLTSLLEETTDEIFIPVTVGGGIRGLDDVRRLLNSGADKVAINTAAIAEPALISRIADKYGSQAIVVSIEAKRSGDRWEAYTDNGRNHSGRDAIEWAFLAIEHGAGELLVTSIDQEGTRKGFDIELIRQIAPNVSVPVIACGGMGSVEHLIDVLERGKADAVAFASVLHYGKLTIGEMRNGLAKRKLQAEGGSDERRDALGQAG